LVLETPGGYRTCQDFSSNQRTMEMSWFKRFLLRWICRNIVIQGPGHTGNIVEYYRIMNESARFEFCEDNEPTLKAFLSACHETAWKKTIESKADRKFHTFS